MNNMSAEYFRKISDELNTTLDNEAGVKAQDIFENQILPAIANEAAKGKYHLTYWLPATTNDRIMKKLANILYNLGYAVGTHRGQDLEFDINWRR